MRPSTTVRTPPRSNRCRENQPCTEPGTVQCPGFGTLPANRPATRPISSSNNSCHRAGSTLSPAATARPSRVDTTRDDQAVAAPRPGLVDLQPLAGTPTGRRSPGSVSA
jgi:hypothetical protein